MKKFYLLLCTLFCVAGLSAQIYVDADATGAGDGSTWADAYTSLDDALAAATTGDAIWVADGTYVPSGDRFVVNSAVSLIGGFSGSETDAGDADPDANLTILSGDVDGNDDPNDVTANRDDNKRIMFVDSLGMDEIVSISGFTFSGGQTAIDPSDDGSGGLLPFSGSSIQAVTTIHVDNCNFTNNGSDLGNLVIFRQGASGSRVTNCNFDGNLGLRRAGAIYARDFDDLLIDECSVTNNTGERGAIYLIGLLGVRLSDTDFEDNSATGRGAALGIIQCDDTRVEDCDFDNNLVVGTDAFARGGAVYIFDDFSLPQDPSRVIFNECDFTANATAGLLGGCVYALNADYTFANCDFVGNSAATHGGAIFSFAADGAQRHFVMNGCNVEDSQVGAGIDGLGTAVTTIFPHTVDVLNSTFSDNGNATTGGRGTFTTFGDFDTLLMNRAEYNFTNVSFNNNTGSLGGAIHTQSPTNTFDVNIRNSSFSGNVTADRPGGAIYSFSGVNYNIDNVEGNFNTSNDGGFAYIRGDGAPDPPAGVIDAQTTITNSVISENFASIQGGGIDATSAADIDIINSAFYGNAITDAEGGSGGAVIFNGDSIGQTVNLINNTFVGNTAIVAGDDVAVYISGALGAGSLPTDITVTNNIFASTGNGVGAIANEPDPDGGTTDIMSGGGNFFIQDPGTDIAALQPSDAIDETVDPADLFVLFNVTDLVEVDLTPADPILINTGVTGANIPDTDLNGNVRDDMPDKGAIEVDASELQSVVDIIVNSPDHETLESLVVQAGLVDALNGDGPFTVFAPTDDAFGLVDADALAAVAADNALLTDVLLTHVVQDDLFAAELTDGLSLPTLRTYIYLDVASDGINTQVSAPGSEVATVTVTDLPARNGVVHVIDRVLISTIVSVRDLDAAGIEVEFFPNPVKDVMNVQVGEAGIENVSVSVVNLNGQRVSNWTMGAGNNFVDFSRLPAGAYTLEVNIDGQLYSKRIVKQ